MPERPCGNTKHRHQTSVKKNYFYNLISQILVIIVPFITTPYVSRVLGAENIGIFSFVNANVVYFTLIGVFGLSTYSTLEIARRRDNERELQQFCVESFLTRCVTAGFSILLFTTTYLVGEQKYKVYYAICSCTLLANALDITWIYQGLEEFKIITIRNCIIKFFGVVAIFVFVRTDRDLARYVTINCLSTLLGNLSLFPYVSKYIGPVSNLSRIKIWPHIKASLIFFLPSVASVVIGTVDKLMIGWFALNMTQNGFYEQAIKIESAIFMLFASLNLTMRPRMAYLYKTKQIDAINKYMYQSMSLFSFLAFPIVFGLIQISDIFVPWFFGEGFQGVIMLLKIMSFWILTKAVSGCLLEQSIVPKGGQVLATKIIWFAAICNALLNALLIPKYSAIGAAVASLITEISSMLIILNIVHKEINITALFDECWKDFISAMVMFVCIGCVKHCLNKGSISIIVMVIIGIMIYLIMEFCLKNKIIINTLKGYQK